MPEMFSAPRPNLIVSDSGFSVEVLGRSGIVYSEYARSVHVNSEVLVKPGDIVIWRNSIKRWDPPNEGDPIGPEDRTRIVENIRRAFDGMGYVLDQLQGGSDMADLINIPVTRAAAVALRHWLSAVPVAKLPVTDPSERQAVADLLTQLELSVGEAEGSQLAEAQRTLLKDAGEWVYKGATYKAEGE